MKSVSEVRIELDVTPSWWRRNGGGPASAAAFVLAIQTFLAEEVRASRTALRVLAKVPRDVALEALEHRRAAFVEHLEQAGEQDDGATDADLFNGVRAKLGDYIGDRYMRPPLRLWRNRCDTIVARSAEHAFEIFQARGFPNPEGWGDFVPVADDEVIRIECNAQGEPAAFGEQSTIVAKTAREWLEGRIAGPLCSTISVGA